MSQTVHLKTAKKMGINITIKKFEKKTKILFYVLSCYPWNHHLCTFYHASSSAVSDLIGYEDIK